MSVHFFAESLYPDTGHCIFDGGERMKQKAAVSCAVFAALGSLSGCARETPPQASSDAAEIAQLREQVTYLRDRQDIAETLQRYIRGIDRHDKELVRSAFWPEARINLGTPNNREEYVDREEAALAAYARHQHHITGQTFDIQGNTAHVESYVWFVAVPRDTSQDTPGPAATPGHPRMSGDTQLGSGRYIERWEKRNGEWKIESFHINRVEQPHKAPSASASASGATS